MSLPNPTPSELALTVGQQAAKGSSGKERAADWTQSVEITHGSLRNRFGNFLPIPNSMPGEVLRIEPWFAAP